jgi:hypothetical protein
MSENGAVCWRSWLALRAPHPVVGVGQIVHEGLQHRGGGAAVWLCSPMLTFSKSLSLSSPFASPSAGQPSHLTSQLHRHQALAAALLTAVVVSTPACWSQLPNTITAHTHAHSH